MSTTPREKWDRPSICIDGFNLAASQGTGIATYSRNLLEAASRLGFRTEALFGPTLSPTCVKPFGEVAILDPERPATPLLDIVPSVSGLVVEAQVAPMDIDRVAIGKRADTLHLLI